MEEVWPPWSDRRGTGTSSVAIRARSGVMIMQELGELLAKAFIALCVVPGNHGVPEQLFLNLGRQLGPYMNYGGA